MPTADAPAGRHLRARAGHAPRAAGSAPALVFLVVSLLVGTLLALGIPMGAGLDESTHLARAVEVAHLNIFPQSVGTAPGYPMQTEQDQQNARLYGGETDKALFDLAEQNKYAFQGSDYLYAFPQWADPTTHADWELGSQGSEVAVYSNTAVNTPVVYAPYALGYAVARLVTRSAFWTIAIMRLAGVAFFALAGTLCIRRLPFGRWEAATLLTLPNVMVTVSAITADVVSNVVCLCVLTGFFRMAVQEDEPSRADWASLLVPSALLGTVKMTYLPFLLFLAAVFFVRGDLWHRRYVISAVLTAGVALGVFAAWARAISGINTGAMWLPGVNPSQQLAGVLSDPGAFAAAAGRTAAGLNVFQLQKVDLLVPRPLSAVSVWAGAIPLVLGLFIGSRDAVRLTGARRVGLCLVSCALVLSFVVALTMLGMYMSFSPVGDATVGGVQNRYFVTVGLMICLIAAGMVQSALWRVRDGLARARLPVFVVAQALVQGLFLAEFFRVVFGL